MIVMSNSTVLDIGTLELTQWTQAFSKMPYALWIIEDDGRTNEELIASIEAKGRKVTDREKQAVAKANEPIPPKGTVYHLIGILGDEFPTDDHRTANVIFAAAAAQERKHGKPPIRAALLLREKFSQKELGYHYVAVMNDPVSVPDGDPRVSVLSRFDDEDHLEAWSASSSYQWYRVPLFLFLLAVPQPQS